MNRARSPRLVIGIAAAAAVVAVIVGIAVARSGGDEAASPTTAVVASTSTAPSTSAAPGTLPPTVATTTARPSTTTSGAPTTLAAATTTSVAATTTTTATAAPVTVAAATTTTTTIDPDAVPAFPCEAADLLAAFRAAQPAPDGTRLDGVRCYGLYAAGVVSTNGANRAFAVFGAGETGWQLLNIGTAFVCQPLEITDPAYTTIGCPTWDI